MRAVLAASILLILSFSTLFAAGQIRGWINIESRSKLESTHSNLEPVRKAGFKNASAALNPAVGNCSGPITKPLPAPTPLTWNWTHFVSTTVDPSSVVKNGGNDIFNDAYAFSNEALTSDGDSVQWTMAASFLECSVALTSFYSDHFPGYPEFWADFYYGRDENYYCYEAWADNGLGTSDCSGSYSTSSVFKFVRRCDRIEFYVNDVKVWERIGNVPAQLYVVFQAGQIGAGANNLLINSQPPACNCPNIPIVP
jgi:hypothetical protein